MEIITILAFSKSCRGVINEQAQFNIPQGALMRYSNKKLDCKSTVSGSLYCTGMLLSAGMNFKLYGFGFKLLYCVLSWANVGYLIG
ncbi:hypothetical protein LEWO105114_04790 [Legionella worsleiensis]|uniref:Uncharacterized protein n=2 Tax=Legionella worsleiensis TaxID=45076 RepID=A0A0W1AJP5_9GAMM|nr:hypothetical protein Lwor_0544 [Legionella worsleiensis]STY32065.1 Uncharacterised protein [Legionella worsleiensis]